MRDLMKGGYALLLQISGQCTINTRNRQFVLKPGIYIYAGSALGQGGIEARIRRHLRIFEHLNAVDHDKIKKIATTRRNIADIRYHWHVDQLLHTATTFISVYASSRNRIECFLIRYLKEHGFQVIIGFGSTDCGSRCGGHLVYLPEVDVEKTKDVVIKGFRHLSLKPIVGKTYERDNIN